VHFMTRVDGNTDATPHCRSRGATIAGMDACLCSSWPKPDGSGRPGRCVEMNKLRARAHRRGDTCDQTRSARTDGDDTGHEVSGGYGVAMAEGGSAVRIPTTNDLYGEGAYEREPRGGEHGGKWED
jgi:hypothetical protein